MLNPNIEYVDGEKEVKCQHCGKVTQATRVTKFFCDVKCKNKWHYERERRKRDIQLALTSLQTLIGNMPHRGDSDEWDALTLMKSAITSALNGVEK